LDIVIDARKGTVFMTFSLKTINNCHYLSESGVKNLFLYGFYFCIKCVSVSLTALSHDSSLAPQIDVEVLF